ncbi:substrate-binding periplasmic protein [Deinococcus hopiensis]|uniref:Polar amino acid transport system substrate-binding protein n=1 Tax=Deinococcus hopiensis KR-140 TaxID=695939 RepID=A0A1W1UZU0_9DEIO|nr:ABC transporter substrate-binding protein [Deinococcus hopiensis]SMB86281.1 polar amino acid transport system substrate-binding protein [Deinococcus hopiensis KR-140]
MPTPRCSAVSLLLSVLTLAATGTSHAATLSKLQKSGVVKLGYTTNTPGLVTQENGAIAGFAVEFMNLAVKEMKIKSTAWRKTTTTDALLTALNAGTLDAVIDVNLPQVLADGEQAASLACTGGVMFSRPGGPKTEAGLKNARIAISTDHPYFHYVRNLPFEKKINAAPNSNQALLDFLGGSADVLLLDRFDALKMYAKLGPEKLQVSPLLWSQPVAVVVANGSDKQFEAALNAAIKRLQANGTYERLSKKYFTQDVRCTS